MFGQGLLWNMFGQGLLWNMFGQGLLWNMFGKCSGFYRSLSCRLCGTHTLNHTEEAILKISFVRFSSSGSGFKVE